MTSELPQPCTCGVSWDADYDSPEPDVDPDCPQHGQHTWADGSDLTGEAPF